MNKQREVVYGLRNKMLDHGDPREEIEQWLEDLIAGRVEKWCEDRNHPDTWNLKALAEEMVFLLRRPIDLVEIAGDTPSYEELEEKLCALGVASFREKVEHMGGENFLDIARYVILRTIDERWRDHLFELDHLKHGIGLQAYGQKDPLLAYKKEAFEMFDTLVGEIEEESVRNVFRVEYAEEPQRPTRPAPARLTATKEAAASAFKPLSQIYGRHIDKTMSLTVQGFLDLVRLSTPHMNDGGRVMAVSGWDSFRVLPGHALLGAAKAAMETLVKYLAIELAQDKITTVGVCPGPIDTDSFRYYAGDAWEDYAKQWLAQTPSGAYPTPDEVADVMVYLVSPASAAINGQTIVVDGGLSLATMPIGFGQD